MKEHLEPNMVLQSDAFIEEPFWFLKEPFKPGRFFWAPFRDSFPAGISPSLDKGPKALKVFMKSVSSGRLLMTSALNPRLWFWFWFCGRFPGE
ncbi:hypothetical protein EYF80_056794 [Liparis tanakae]|uniref:Uncharacterized protein n=1 Tax=Liparis tanakae TaxID=230148 RepID=A0A4Z2EXH5_9TELE|nr:hypothetical protein EYF80_056794 [Liparis tanakae]